jgi:hypothetical protein
LLKISLVDVDRSGSEWNFERKGYSEDIVTELKEWAPSAKCLLWIQFNGKVVDIRTKGADNYFDVLTMVSAIIRKHYGDMSGASADLLPPMPV